MPPAKSTRHCACFNLRRAARAVTQLYDDALRPLGLRVTQFSILGALHGVASVTISDLAERLGTDRTTLTRNLRPLRRDRLVEVQVGDDRRVREVAITEAGRKLVEEAYPLWQRTQRRLRNRLGDRRFEDALRILEDVSDTLSHP